MDYHRQEQQYGQPLPPLVDDRMLYCPRPMMAGISSPYDGFMRPYGGAGCATLPHHIPHHIGGAMPPTPINPYQAMVHGQQVVPPVGYMPPPSSLHAAYAGARQYLNSMMASPPMLVPHSHSSMFPTDSQVVLTPPMRPTPPMVNHMTVAPSATENTPSNDAILSMPPKLIPASVASRNREVNLSLKPPPLKSHPNVSDLSSTLQSPPGPMPRTVHSSSEQVDHVQRNNLLSYATSALQSWNRSSENRCLETPEQTLDLTIRSLLVSKASTANTTTVSTIKTELAEKPSVDNDTMSVDNASHSIVDGATYDADEQKYVCLSCSYSTPRATKIQQHLKAHAGQLICEDCGKAFIQTCDLERHLNAHLHGRARNSGTKFNMADILLPHGSSDSCDDLPGMVHRHGDMDAVSVVQSEHAHDGRSVDSSDWLAKSPLAPHSEHALSTHVSSLPSLQHSNSCTSSDSELAIVNCFSVSQNYHNAPTDQDSLTQNVVPAENEIGCCSDGEAVTVALQSPSEAALMLESYRRHMDSIHASPTAGTVPKVPRASHAAITMDTMGSESAEMRTSPQMAAPSGERTVLDKARNMARLAVETSPQQSTDLANRFPYSGALAQAARDVNERFSVSTGGPQSVVSENEETSERNSNSSNNEAGLNQKRHLDGTEDTNIKQQKTSVTPPHGSVNQQLIDHLLQSDESPSPSQENDANDVLMSPQGALSSLPISGMFSEPPPMFLPDGTGGAATSPLRFPPADIVSSPPPFAAGVSLCCTLCNYTGRSQRSLQKHYKAHSMSYKICRYCGKAFERPSDLLRHEERHQMAIQRNHTPVIMRGGNFSSKKSGSATTGTRTKAKHAKVLHCRRCGFATTEHHILALHNKKQHQPANWFCSVCGQKFISKTSLELHCIVAHPVVAVRIDSYIKNVLTDTKVLSCSVGADNVIQLDDVSMVWFETLKEQEIPMVSSVMDLKDIVQQTDGTVRNHCEFGDVRDADRPIDLSTYADSPDRNDVTSPEMMLGDSVQTTMDVANKSCGSTSQREINDSVLQTPCSAEASPAVGDLSPPACGVSRDIFAKSGSPRKDVVQVASPADSQPTVVSQSSDKTPKGTSKNRESRHARLCRYTCDQCSYQSNILRKMTQHKHAHDGRYICKLCYKAFIKTSDLTRHWMTHKIMLEGELKCDSCDYHSSDGDQLELHMKIHYHQRGMYNMRNSSKHRACTICHEWVYKKAMRRHMLRVHNWPPGGSTASKAGSSKTSLANCSPQASPGKAVMKKSPSSVLTPNARGGASPKTPPGTSKRKQSGYTCPECNVSFSSSRAIIQHLVVAHPSDTAATHSGKKQTAVNCSATSVAVCELCNREFADTIRLARHKAWHTRVSHPTRRQCPICHKQFKTVTYLNQHMQLHSNQKPYECDRCGATFGLHQTLLKHEQRNCSPLRRRAHHVAEDIVSAIDGDTTEDVKLNNFAHTNGVGTVDSDYAV